MHLIESIEGKWHLSETYQRPIRAKDGGKKSVCEGRRGPISGCELQALGRPAHSFHAQAKTKKTLLFLSTFEFIYFLCVRKVDE